MRCAVKMAILSKFIDKFYAIPINILFWRNWEAYIKSYQEKQNKFGKKFSWYFILKKCGTSIIKKVEQANNTQCKSPRDRWESENRYTDFWVSHVWQSGQGTKTVFLRNDDFKKKPLLSILLHTKKKKNSNRSETET